jgi:hypothetical protein
VFTGDKRAAPDYVVALKEPLEIHARHSPDGEKQSPEMQHDFPSRHDQRRGDCVPIDTEAADDSSEELFFPRTQDHAVKKMPDAGHEKLRQPGNIELPLRDADRGAPGSLFVIGKRGGDRRNRSVFAPLEQKHQEKNQINKEVPRHQEKHRISDDMNFFRGPQQVCGKAHDQRDQTDRHRQRRRQPCQIKHGLVAGRQMIE